MVACFVLNALSFLVVIDTLMMLRVKHIPPSDRGRMQDELKSGLSYVRSDDGLARADRARRQRRRSSALRC